MNLVNRLNRPKKYAAVIISVLVIILFLAPMNEPLYTLILFPLCDTRTPNVEVAMQKMRAQNFRTNEIVFPSRNGNLLHGLFIERSDTRRVFLFSHTKGNNMYGQFTKAALLLCCGGSVFMYDYQGFGRSQGSASVVRTCEDAEAAYDYLIAHEHRNAKDIIAYGQSWGCGVSGRLAEHRQLGGVIMHSGFASLRSTGREQLFWLRFYPDWCFPTNLAMDNVAIFSKPHPPLLIVHGKTDTTIPVREAETLYARSIEPKSILLLEKGHNTYDDGFQFAAVVKKFLKDNGI